MDALGPGTFITYGMFARRFTRIGAGAANGDPSGGKFAPLH
jgi:hypothetical protein